MMSTYSAMTQRYFHHTAHVGVLSQAQANVGVGRAGTADNGDVVQISIAVNDAGKITQAKFKAYGGVATIAAAAWVTEWLQQHTLIAAETLNDTQILSALELSPLKRHCALLVCTAVQKALADISRPR